MERRRWAPIVLVWLFTLPNISFPKQMLGIMMPSKQIN